jgi:peroxiredoxin Q/BCP
VRKINVGDEAPDFELNDQNGNVVRLSDFKGKQIVVLYFYPRDHTFGCTIEACSFRDSYSDFEEAGTKIIGVSPDSVSSHLRFVEKNKLPFTLLSDPEKRVKRMFDSSKLFGKIESRVTYIIDKEGIVQHVFRADFFWGQHKKEALKVVKSLS